MYMLARLLLAATVALASPRRSHGWDVGHSWSRRDCTSSLPAARSCARQVLGKMNQTEKIAMLHGNDKCPPPQPEYCRGYTGYVVGNRRLGIPPLQMNDGPQGFRQGSAGSTTAFPSGLAAAASWDVAVLGKWGDAMGREFFAKGANVQLGPGLCVARIPKNGRNFEYLSGEDPYLGATLVPPVIRGIQRRGVIANAKHWAMNSQETDRMTVDEYVDERTRFEMFYPPFAAAAAAGVGSVMCSYNKINGFWSCENNVTLHELKNKLNFTGWVMSDWEAAHSSLSLMDGLDQEMPGYGGAGPAMGTSKILARLANGTITQAAIDQAVMNQLTPMFKLGIMTQPASAYNPNKLYHNVSNNVSLDVARQVSAAGTVLLKNDGSLLPIKQDLTIAVIGLADTATTIVSGGGSGSVQPSFHGVVTPVMGITAAAGKKASITFSSGSDSGAAVAAAKAADVAIVFVGAMSGEGADRKDLRLGSGLQHSRWNQDALVEAVGAAQKNTAVVVATPGAILMPWSPRVPAILTNFMPGEQVGNSIADVLFGFVNPCARLPLTFPNEDNEEQWTPDQWPYTNKSDPVVHFTEKLDFGYRYYDSHRINFTTGFPFGHGLSYTQFSYNDLNVSSFDGVISVTTLIKNTGSVKGAEIVQLYLGYPAVAREPPKVLRGFTKVVLQPRESGHARFMLTQQDLSAWDVGKHDWKVVRGTFDVFVGASSRDIRLNGRFSV